MPHSPRFSLGARVRIEDPRFPKFWANGAQGTISAPPGAVIDLAGGWTGHVRMVNTVAGLQPYYWVVLDEARIDGDGDGPYHEAEIAEAALRAIG
ncbi:MAG: hypothetical protein JWO05_1017 [Gemmatimonadetes bacterium]|nr:hypothetical protein [Gemmatimonadota bacterium]